MVRPWGELDRLLICIDGGLRASVASRLEKNTILCLRQNDMRTSKEVVKPEKLITITSCGPEQL